MADRRAMAQTVLTVAALILSLAAVVAGLAWIYPPLGPITGGLSGLFGLFWWTRGAVNG